MIFRGAVDEFLKRPRDDLRRYKKLSKKELMRRVRALDPAPTFILRPRKSQLVGFLLCVQRNMLLNYDMGLGKTKMVLDAVRWLKRAGRISRALVLVPNVINLESWRSEIKIHAPDLSVSYLIGTSNQRKEAWEADSDLCVGTYVGIHTFLTKSSGKRKTKTKRIVDPSRIKKANRLFDGAIFDECQALMNPRSLTFRVVKSLTASFSWRVGLTGTPVGRDAQALWGQFFCIDRGHALGETIGIFRQALFNETPKYFGGFDYTIKKGSKTKLRRFMAHSSVRYLSSECVDLPKRVDIEKRFVLSEEARVYYRSVQDRVAAARGDGGLPGAFVLLRMIASGFMKVDGQYIDFRDNQKLELLLDLLCSVVEKSKVVVFHDFVHTGALVSKAIASEGVKCSRLYSGTRDRREELRRFCEDEDCRVLVANTQSAGKGLNLQVAKYEFFYESPTSPMLRQQAEKRCHRPGQRRSVFVYDLVGAGTIEKRILTFLKEGRDLSEELFGDAGRRLLGIRR